MKKLLLLLIFTGCVSTGYMFKPSNYFVDRTYVDVQNDEFSSEYEFLGISSEIKKNQNPDGIAINYYIRSFVNKDSREQNHQLYVSIYYMRSDWHFFRQASFKGGESAELIDIASDAFDCSAYYGCWYNETVGVTLPKEFLEKNDNGFSVKLYANSGQSIILEVSSNQVSGQLEAIENTEINN